IPSKLPSFLLRFSSFLLALHHFKELYIPALGDLVETRPYGLFNLLFSVFLPRSFRTGVQR
ncbi:MAG: hypothetical protein ACQEW9_18825, partial [Bacteroidota bacterium]